MWLFNVIVSNVNKMKTCGNAMSDSQMEQNAAKRIKLEISERPLNFAISPYELEIQSVKKAKLPRWPFLNEWRAKVGNLEKLLIPDYIQRMTNLLEQSSKELKSASDFQDVKPDNSLMSEATMSNFNSSRNGQVVQGMGISENNMAVIKQDKQLCTLLTPTKQTSSQTSGYCSSSYQSLSDGSSSCITLQSVQRDTAEKNECYRSRGSSCSSDQNSSEDSNRHKIDYHKSHSYKFKHNITKRFSQERRSYHLKSDISSDSMEDGNEQGKQNQMGCKTSSPGTQHSQYLGSQNSSTDVIVPLPAFVLHPLGTHYVPVTIHPTHFKKVFKDETNTQASAAYHPISIPINFCGPNVSIHPHVDQQLLFASERQKEETYSENSSKWF
ncbi:unnamed protein product [Mytilus edulis]|uniref:Uncharacterized protein n=1 Tax=Mytilus edulis TaxID=6550 RepID=A0A8S3QHL4_MYTED|nr:unnamed protein product [Mytilus edulis]